MLARLSNQLDAPLVGVSDSESNPGNNSGELTTKQMKRKRKFENIPRVRSGCFSMVCQKTIRSQEEIYEAHLAADGRELPAKYKWIKIEDPKEIKGNSFLSRIESSRHHFDGNY